MNYVNRRNNKNDNLKSKKEEDKDKGNNDATRDKATSGNTNKTGENFKQNSTPDEGDVSKKDFDLDHNTVSNPRREQSQRPPAQKSGHNGTQRYTMITTGG